MDRSQIAKEYKYLTKHAVVKYGRDAVLALPLSKVPHTDLLHVAYNMLWKTQIAPDWVWGEEITEAICQEIQLVADKMKEIIRAFPGAYRRKEQNEERNRKRNPHLFEDDAEEAPF